MLGTIVWCDLASILLLTQKINIYTTSHKKSVFMVDVIKINIRNSMVGYLIQIGVIAGLQAISGFPFIGLIRMMVLHQYM